MKLRTLIPFLFFVSSSAAAQPPVCDGDIEIRASRQCYAPIIDSWRKHIVPLYTSGHLGLYTDAVLADCTCEGGAGSNVAFCTATYAVHSCMVDKQGTMWFSKDSKIIGLTNNRFNGNIQPNDMSLKLQELALEASENAAINLKNEVLKQYSKSK